MNLRTLHRSVLLLGIVGLAVPAIAQLTPGARETPAIEDASRVIDIRGARVELFAERRVVLQESRSGAEVMRETAKALESAPLGQGVGMLVFNHAYQAYGYASGEIAFKFKAGRAPGTEFDPAQYPGFKRLGTLAVYAVYARDPLEFLSLVRRLEGRGDLEWLVPTILYVPKI